MPYGFLYDTLSLEALQTAPFNKGDTPPNPTTRSDTNITDANKMTKDYKYIWLYKKDK